MNLHGTACLAGTCGLLVTGASGLGKTSLALAILDHCRCEGRPAWLVSDDQVLLESAGGRLVVRAPDAIAGLVEIRGYGPARVTYEPAAVVDLVVRLVDTAGQRMPEPATTNLAGIELPLLELPARRSAISVAAILARMGEESRSCGGK